MSIWKWFVFSAFSGDLSHIVVHGFRGGGVVFWKQFIDNGKNAGFSEVFWIRYSLKSTV